MEQTKSGRTEYDVIQFTYRWAVPKFSYFLANPTVILSPTFVIENYGNDYWQLQLKYDATYKDYSANLILQAVPKALSISFSFSIIGANNVKIHTWTTTVFEPLQKVQGINPFIKDDEFRGAKKGQFLPNDTLTLCCNIKILKGFIYTAIENSNVTFNKTTCTLADDMRKLFEDQKSGDLTIRCSDRTFRVHRNILAARSTVFQSMLYPYPTEYIDITDVTVDTVREMLRFIYTDEVQNLSALASGLIDLADRYAISRLKTVCEEALYKDLDIDNAANTLIVAHVFHAPQLKTHVLCYVAKNMTEIMKTQGYQRLVTWHGYLITEAYTSRSLNN